MTCAKHRFIDLKRRLVQRSCRLVVTHLLEQACEIHADDRDDGIVGRKRCFIGPKRAGFRPTARLGPETPLFWSTWGRRVIGKTRAPMIGKNIWRLCKVYGRIIGYPELKPHDLRHGVAMEVLEQHHDLEQVRALLGHARIDTTQVYTSIRPPQLKRAVSFDEEKAVRMLSE